MLVTLAVLYVLFAVQATVKGSRSYAVTVRHDAAAHLVAKRYGLLNRGRVLGSVYWFEDVFSLGRSENLLEEDPLVVSVEEQKSLWREKRDILEPDDPYWPQQWSLVNDGQAGENGGDINVEPVWLQGITGRGVTVAIVDDGVFYSHEDLKGNFNSTLSVDLVDGDRDVSPGGADNHGTACAGVVAMARDNRECGVGVAFEATIIGVRLLSNRPHTDVMEGLALSQSPQEVGVVSNSWGPVDNGALVEGPGPLASAALQIGVTEGREGLGTVYVWAAGNGRGKYDSCATDGYVGSIYTIAVGTVNQFGQRAYFDEECPGKMIVTHSHNARHRDRPSFRTQVVATGNKPGSCRTNFLGSSASCALLSGTLALALQANPNLSWRDVQHLLVMTADHTHLSNGTKWTTNGGGYHVSREYGFGALDAEKLVSLARVWKKVPDQLNCTLTSQSPHHWWVEPGAPLTLPLESTSDCPILHLEHVVVYISLSLSGFSTSYQYSDYHRERLWGNLDLLLGHKDVRRGDVSISLRSPQGTLSVLLPKRRNDFVNAEGFNNWPFMTVLNWGESPLGVWSLNFSYDPEMHTRGLVTVTNVSLTLYGTSNLPTQHTVPSCGLRNATDLQCVDNCPSSFLTYRGYCIDPDHKYVYTDPQNPATTPPQTVTTHKMTPHHSKSPPTTLGSTTTSFHSDASTSTPSYVLLSVCLLYSLCNCPRF